MVERVLVLPRAEVPGGCDFQGVRPVAAHEVAALRRALARHGRWADRPAAEEDARTKQVIPYVVVRDTSTVTERVFLMERTEAGGDPRLHHRATIGMGGHLNPVDGDGGDAADPLTAGLHREWREELVADWEPDFRPIGFLNDDRNPVGQVHLGVVFAVDAAGRNVAVREHRKLTGRMVPTADLAGVWERLETWSQLTAEALWGRPGS